MTSKEINSLGQILDTTFGKSSSDDGTRSIKTSIAGNILTVKYMTVVHFGSETSMSSQVSRYANEAAQMINSYMKKVKSEFKNLEGRTLKAKDMGGNDNVELISSTAHSLRKVAYYRVNRTFEIA